MMAWVYLLVAAVFEIGFAAGMKAAEGFTRLWPSVFTAVTAAGGVTFLTLALKELPVSVGYPVWVGIGVLGTTVVGMTMFGEGMTPLKAVSILAIVAGVVGLKVATPAA